jgi:Mn-containing catalase
MRVDRLITELPPPKKQGSNAATALQEISGGKYGKMSTFGNTCFQSCNFRSKASSGRFIHWSRQSGRPSSRR